MTNLKKITAAVAAGALVLSLGGCFDDKGSQRANSSKMMDARNAKVDKIVLCGDANDSLECKNLRERFKRESDPTKVTYLYALNTLGTPFGYWVVKGKVSSTQSQMAPQDQVLDICPGTTTCWTVMEAPGDDGSSGPNEDGIFFFAADGTMLTYNGTYIQSDRPLKLDVPILYGSEVK